MDMASLGSGDWDDLVCRLGVELDESSAEHGALLRRRRIPDGASLLRLALVYGTTSLSLRSTAAWGEAAGIARLSDVALLYRLQGAEAWLHWVLRQSLSRELACLTSSISRPVMGRPTQRIRLIDGSVIRPSKSGGYPGWRLHASLDLASGNFGELQLTTISEGEKLDRFAHQPGDILVADRAFAGATEVHAVLAQGCDVVVRRGIGARNLRTEQGDELRPADLLAEAAKADLIDLPVRLPLADIGRNKKKTRLVERRATPPRAMRLIIKRLPKAAAEKARTRLQRKIVTHQQKTVRPERLPPPAYLFILTSLPQSEFDAEQICRLYRLRWQIELAFKRLKSLINLDEFDAIDERLTRTVLYAKLILAILCQNLVAQIIALSPSDTTAEAR